MNFEVHNNSQNDKQNMASKKIIEKELTKQLWIADFFIKNYIE